MISCSHSLESAIEGRTKSTVLSIQKHSSLYVFQPCQSTFVLLMLCKERSSHNDWKTVNMTICLLPGQTMIMLSEALLQVLFCHLALSFLQRVLLRDKGAVNTRVMRKFLFPEIDQNVVWKCFHTVTRRYPYLLIPLQIYLTVFNGLFPFNIKNRK